MKKKSLTTLEIIGLIFSIYVIAKFLFYVISSAQYGWTHPQ